ncbi:MAG: hypothetical protein NTV86_04710 [Planctomycetota bacterium]|nr:hypothetical protein [Planctomycetota bacterium]
MIDPLESTTSLGGDLEALARRHHVTVIDEGKVVVPIVALEEPGVFAALRWWGQGPQCPECGYKNPILHGTRQHGHARIQQFRCGRKQDRESESAACGRLLPNAERRRRRKQGKRNESAVSGCGAFFNEYTQTPLDGSVVTAHEWVLIYYWRHQHTPRRTFRDIARIVNLPPSTVHWVATHKQAYPINVDSARRKKTIRRHLVRALLGKPADRTFSARTRIFQYKGSPAFYLLLPLRDPYRAQDPDVSSAARAEGERRATAVSKDRRKTREERASRFLRHLHVTKRWADIALEAFVGRRPRFRA